MELLLVKYIKENPDWETKLGVFQDSVTGVEKRCIHFTRDDGYIIFNYYLNADFTVPLYRECRGIILEESTLTTVCVPFF